MNRKREAVFMGLGILVGLALSGPAVQAADHLTARPSSQAFYINGQQASLTAYAIGGNNYVRLRDIGKAVDFGVTYDAATNSVHIDSTQPYQEEPPQIIPGSFEERVQITLAQLKNGILTEQSIPRRTNLPAVDRIPRATTALAGPACALMQLSAICLGGG